MSEVSILGGQSLSDYFLGSGSAVPPADIGVANFANSWVAESAFTSPVSPGINQVFPAQPSFFSTLGQSFKDIGGSILTGATETAQGMAKALPGTLVNMLAGKMGLKANTVQAENGKSVTYLTQASPGVPAAGTSPATIVNTGTVAGITTSTILVGIAIAIAVYLMVKSR